MKKKTEFINFPYNFPITISLNKVANQENDWNTIVKILYCLEGSCEVIIQNKTYNFASDDIILINPYIIYEIKAISPVAFLEVGIDFSKYDVDKSLYENFTYSCNSTNDPDKSKFKILKESIFALIRINTKDDPNNEIINKVLSYQILYLMINQYKIQTNQEKKLSQKYFVMLKNIIEYIDENYTNDISLNEVSEHFGYTPQYFSSFFKKHMNQNFQEYYDSLRINKSIQLLRDTDKTIDEIALTNGFSDYRGYIRAFKSIYGVSPSDYRLKKEQKDKTMSYLSFDRKHYLDIIFKNESNDFEQIQSTVEHSFDLVVNYNNKGEILRKTYLNMVGIGKASDVLREAIQEALKIAQKEIGFKYLKLTGIFGDDLHVFRRFVNKKKSYSFVFLDQVIDFLMSINLKPYLVLSYMPRDMAKNPDHIIFESKYVSSMPKNMNEWNELVYLFFNHIIDRYTLAEVITWPISVWNCPDSSTHAFGFEQYSDFYMLYKNSYDTIKAISNDFKIGTPGLIPFANWAHDFDIEFLKYCSSNGCDPDFIDVHYYSNDFDFFITGKKVEKISKNPDSLALYISNIKNNPLTCNKKIYLTEWNTTSSHRNYLNDTIFSSCYITKNILENIDNVECFCKWCLSDFMDVTQLPNYIYHGGLGMFTYNGLPKASFNAYKFLSKLEGQCIEKGKGYFITKGENKISIILYNYTHFSDIYADGEFFSLKANSRYQPFSMNLSNKYNLVINNLDYDYARIKTTSITRDSGSSYDIFSSMTSTELQSRAEIEELKALSIPKFTIRNEEIINNSISLTENVFSLEVKLIEIVLYKKKEHR